MQSLSVLSKQSTAEKKGVAAEIAPLQYQPVAVTHINLPVYVMMHPQGARAFKRGQRLKPVKPDHSTELWYRSELAKLIRVLKNNTSKYILPALKQDNAETWVGDAKKKTAVKMSVSPRVRAAMRDNRGAAQNIQAVATRLTNTFIKRNLASVDTGLAKSINTSLGVNIRPAFTSDGPIRDKIRAATETNVALIKSIPEQYHDKIDALITESYQQGTRFNNIEEDIQRIGDVTDSRAHLIARDQTSKLNSAFNMARQMSIGIEEYEWQTAGDERVRETHAENEGKVFRWDSPPEETGNPGDDVNCRCNALPIFNFDQMDADAGE